MTVEAQIDHAMKSVERFLHAHRWERGVALFVFASCVILFLGLATYAMIERVDTASAGGLLGLTAVNGGLGGYISLVIRKSHDVLETTLSFTSTISQTTSSSVV